MFGRIHQQPPRRASTLSNVFRARAPKVELTPTFIPCYQLRWLVLKEWLDKRFKDYNVTFTERYTKANDDYVVDLPEKLTGDDWRQIAGLKEPATPVAST